MQVSNFLEQTCVNQWIERGLFEGVVPFLGLSRMRRQQSSVELMPRGGGESLSWQVCWYLRGVAQPPSL